MARIRTHLSMMSRTGLGTYLLRVVTAMSVLLNVILGGKLNQTFSARNWDWKKNNKPTNVLAFPNNNKIDNISSYNYIGDIIISYDKVKNESIFYKVSLKDHLMHLIIHGVLHLMGYDHNNIKSEKVMIKLEKKIIEKIGVDCTILNRKYDERN